MSSGDFSEEQIVNRFKIIELQLSRLEKLFFQRAKKYIEEILLASSKGKSKTSTGTAKKSSNFLIRFWLEFSEAPVAFKETNEVIKSYDEAGNFLAMLVDLFMAIASVIRTILSPNHILKSLVRQSPKYPFKFELTTASQCVKLDTSREDSIVARGPPLQPCYEKSQNLAMKNTPEFFRLTYGPLELKAFVQVCDERQQTNVRDRLRSINPSSTSFLNFIEKRLLLGDLILIEKAVRGFKFDLPNVSQLLERCISCGCTESARFLLHRAVEISQYDEKRRTVLMLAADYGQHVLIRDLIEYSSIDATDNEGRTALARACKAGHVRVAKLLLDKKADPKTKDKDGLDCKQLAEKFGHYQIVRLLDSNDFKYRGFDTCGSSNRPGAESDNSKLIKKLLTEAGFIKQRVVLQQKLGDFLQTTVRQITPQDYDVYLIGSYAEGWGSSFSRLDDSVSIDSDINWTILVEPDEPAHLLSGCVCESVKTKVHDQEGYATLEASTGSEPALKTAACGAKSAESTCFAIPCCSSSLVAEEREVDGQLMTHSRENLPLYLVRASRPNAEQEARISYSFLERRIMKNLDELQGQFYVLLKYVIKKVLSGQISTVGLKTYHAKTLLFYLLTEVRWCGNMEARKTATKVKGST